MNESQCVVDTYVPSLCIQLHVYNTRERESRGWVSLFVCCGWAMKICRQTVLSTIKLHCTKYNRAEQFHRPTRQMQQRQTYCSLKIRPNMHRLSLNLRARWSSSTHCSAQVLANINKTIPSSCPCAPTQHIAPHTCTQCLYGRGGSPGWIIININIVEHGLCCIKL